MIRIRGPRNNFGLADSPSYLFVAGGIGITPILPMIAAAQAASADWHLLYGGRCRASMAFPGELAGYGDRVTVAPQDETGLLDLDTFLGSPRPDALVYCCGPEPLLAAVEERCRAWPPGSLRVERFSARPLTAPVRAEAFEVGLARSELKPELLHAALRLTARGWETGSLPAPDGSGSLVVALDLHAHEAVVEHSRGSVQRVPLVPDRPVAEVMRDVLAAVARAGGAVRINPVPQEVPWSVPLDQDYEHARYDPGLVEEYFAAATQAALALAAFRAPYRGRSTPVNAWWARSTCAW